MKKVALARAAYRMVEQIQTVVNSTVFGGAQLLDGNFSSDFVIGMNAQNNLQSLEVNLKSTNADFNIVKQQF